MNGGLLLFFLFVLSSVLTQHLLGLLVNELVEQESKQRAAEGNSRVNPHPLHALGAFSNNGSHGDAESDGWVEAGAIVGDFDAAAIEDSTGSNVAGGDDKAVDGGLLAEVLFLV